MVRALQLTIGLMLLVALEVMRVYYIMPFPGSQQTDEIEFAYFLHRNIFWLRTVGILIIFFPVIHFYWLGTKRSKWIVSIALVVYLYVFMLFNFRMQADKMFYEPSVKTFERSKGENKVKPEQLVLGININGEAKAYPIEIIGYHHQVRDTVGGESVMITYCTVCRTGRVYSPMIDGKSEKFRLVGMDQFNAMFEDETTGSWWRQVSGEAVAGPLKGQTLKEIPSRQVSLKRWLSEFPDSKILQPDTIFNEQYKELAEFDEGTIPSGLEKRDSASWKEKSWIVGVQIGNTARAYDWNELVAKRVINDELSGTRIVLAIESDSATFHVWERDSLEFAYLPVEDMLTDNSTKSRWSWEGSCVQGPLNGRQLTHVQSYQEFWHSWRTFRPGTSRYGATK